jgi:pimeloyl-ACP methyl ester carboxylesterase
VNRRIRKILKHLSLAIGYGLLGAMVIAISGYIYLLESRPDLKIWHEARLDSEFTAEQTDTVSTLDAYLKTEDRVMQELQTKVYDQLAPADQRDIVRYYRGSSMDPESRTQNWNRTFELAPQRPVAGALLIHGLSDSPYSMRAIAQSLYEHDVLALGMRMPGHGTAPSGLVDVHWKDFVAAARIGLKYLQQRMGDAPVFIVGYSNGATLAVEYALGPLEGLMIPQVDALVLISPAIGVTPVAALARWQGRLGNLAGLRKLAWNSIELEFDPYKYNSFSVNAGDQIYRLTSEIERRIDNLAAAHGLEYFPRTLAFQSVVDATVPARALLDKFYLKLQKNGGHELVLFDVNRHTETEPLLRSDPESLAQSLLEDSELPFNLTLVTNLDPATDDLVARNKITQSPFVFDLPLDLSWPAKVFSLSHVALPFRPDDPLYGASHTAGDARITLGSVHIQGERNLLQIPDSYFLRLRHNPFFDYMMERIIGFLDLEVKP